MAFLPSLPVPKFRFTKTAAAAAAVHLGVVVVLLVARTLSACSWGNNDELNDELAAALEGAWRTATFPTLLLIDKYPQASNLALFLIVVNSILWGCVVAIVRDWIYFFRRGA